MWCNVSLMGGGTVLTRKCGGFHSPPLFQWGRWWGRARSAPSGWQTGSWTGNDRLQRANQKQRKRKKVVTVIMWEAESRSVVMPELWMTTYVCKASESVFSGRAFCSCCLQPSWCGSPVCCSGSCDSPDTGLCRRLCCRHTCRPYSACLYSAESQWRDGRIAHGHISLSARNLWERQEGGKKAGNENLRF